MNEAFHIISDGSCDLPPELACEKKCNRSALLRVF